MVFSRMLLLRALVMAWDETFVVPEPARRGTVEMGLVVVIGWVSETLWLGGTALVCGTNSEAGIVGRVRSDLVGEVRG